MVVGFEGSTEVGEQDADRLFNALADRTRRDILRRSIDGALSVSALSRSYEMSFAAVQKHVAVLERAGLVAKHRRGREQLVHSDIATIRTAQRLLDEFEGLWRDRVNRFADLAAQPLPPNQCRPNQ
jgi:DNA-binding transcriptional ArsR family regulator